MATVSLSEALSTLIYRITKGENVTLVKMKASQTKEGVTVPNPALDYKEFWTSGCAYPMTEEEKKNKRFLNDTERDLFFNYRTIYVHNGKEHHYGVMSKRPLKPGEKNYFQPQWKPIDGVSRYVNSFDPLIDCYEIVTREGPQDEDQKRIAGRYEIMFTPKDKEYHITISKANRELFEAQVSLTAFVGKEVDPLYRTIFDFVKRENDISDLSLGFIDDEQIRQALREKLAQYSIDGDSFGVYNTEAKTFTHLEESVFDELIRASEETT